MIWIDELSFRIIKQIKFFRLIDMMFNVWIVGALLLLLLFILATFGRGDYHLKEEDQNARWMPPKTDAQKGVKEELVGLVEENKEL